MRSRDKFYGNSARNKKATYFDSKTCFFKEIILLILTNQNKALFIIVINQNEVLCITKKKFSSNIGGDIQEQFWNNEACRFIIVKAIIKNPR